MQDGGDVCGEEEGGVAGGERVRPAAGAAVPPRVGRPVLRRRVPGADARGAPRRQGGGGGHGGRRRDAQLRQRRGRGPGDRTRLLHGQQRHVPAEVCTRSTPTSEGSRATANTNFVSFTIILRRHAPPTYVYERTCGVVYPSLL